jgi:translocation and assembly module TamB
VGQAQPQQPNKSKLIKNLGRVGIGLALTLTATGLGGFWYARYFLNEQLSPLLQAELTKALKRPVQLGKVERVSFTSLRFGRSLVPPTAKEANFLAVEAIEIKVDPFSYLFRRQLALDAIAEQPQIFLKQEVEGGGLKLPDFPPPEPQTGENPFDLKTIIFSDAQITIQSAAKGQLVSLSQIQIDSIWKITDLNNQRLKLNAKGGVVLPNIAAIGSPPNPEQLKKAIETAQANKENHQGNLSFVVDWDLSKGQGTIDVKSQKLQIAPFQGFALSSPVEIQQGTLNTESSISVVIESKSQSPIENTSQNPSQNTPSKTNQKTTQKATQKATINVNGQLNGGAIKLPQSKQLVTDISGQFNFDGNTFTLKDFSASYEFLNANIDGTFNFQKGFNFNFGVAALDLGKVMKSFDFKAPIAIAGEVKLAGKLTGSPEKPAMILNVTTPKAVTFDRVVIDRFLATLELKDANTLQIKKIQAASTGATFTGEGLIRLPQKDKPAEIIFNSNLVGIAEDFANLYGAKLPITIGQISSSLNITGELSNPQVLAQIDASNATYPAKGEVFLADGLATIRNTKVKFPIGEIGLAGTYNVVSGSWKSQLNSNGIPLSAFLLNQKGILQGLINLRSDRGGFALTDIIADATISLPQGLTEIPDAIAANVTWNGKNLLIPSLQVGNYLTANGKIDLAFPSPNAFPTGISALNLDLISRNVNINRLTTLSSFIPNQASGILNFRGNLAGAIDNLKIAGSLQLDNVDLKSLNSTFSKQRIPAPNHGSLNFDGSINGYLNNPKLVGNLRIASLKINQIELDNFTFNGILNGIGNNLQANGNLILAGLRIDKSDKLEFDKRLEGKLNFDGNQGLSIDLRGKRDQIVAQLDNAFRPIDFTVNLGESRAIGQRLDNNPRRLQVEINNIPLALAASLAGQNDVSGKISSKLIVDFTDNPTATGKVTIDQPRLGKLLAEKAIAKVTYANGILDIKDGNLKIRQSELDNEYKFNLTYNPDLDESVSGAVEIIQGRMQDLFATIQWAILLMSLKDLHSPKTAPQICNP